MRFLVGCYFLLPSPTTDYSFCQCPVSTATYAIVSVHNQSVVYYKKTTVALASAVIALCFCPILISQARGTDPTPQPLHSDVFRELSHVV